MKGGIKAWNGETAEGPPEAGMAYFSGASEFSELIFLAWALEDGFGRFYEEIKNQKEMQARDIFIQLGRAEENHKKKLLEAYEKVTGESLDTRKMAADLLDSGNGRTMEGNIPVNEALQWASGRELNEILEFAMSLEANALDLYAKMRRSTENESAKSVFADLINEEQHHLDKLADLLDGQLS